MPLEVGIVGLPQVGKTTLFDALTAGVAAAGTHARGGVKPNIGVVHVPDDRLEAIHKFIETKQVVPAQLQVVDVPGLARGASTGQGLGNKFLAHVRDMDAILHVVRCFRSGDIPHIEGSIDPARDVDTVETELVLADLETVSGSLDKANRAARSGEKEATLRAAILQRAYDHLNEGRPIRELTFTPEERKAVKSMGLITAKKVLFIANVDEDDVLGQSEAVSALRQRAASLGGAVVPVCAKLEAEIIELPEQDRGEMLQSMGLKEPALAAVAREAYRLLGLHSFFTAGPKEIKAWTIPVGATAPQAAGVIHSDFERAFIKAEVYSLADLQQYKTEAEIRHHGKLRIEGKSYVVKDGDIAHFLVGV